MNARAVCTGGRGALPGYYWRRRWCEEGGSLRARLRRLWREQGIIRRGRPLGPRRWPRWMDLLHYLGLTGKGGGNWRAWRAARWRRRAMFYARSGELSPEWSVLGYTGGRAWLKLLDVHGVYALYARHARQQRRG